MRFLRFQFFFLVLLVSGYSFAQTDSDAKGLDQPLSLFTEGECNCKDQWFSEFVQEIQLAEGFTSKYRRITFTTAITSQ
ncbi:hypothetical protein D7Z94_10685 [Ulvibacterium marinum]|uniref:Uncharacterized protein n=1 Tax=Ulvibacterium marinum TaxID=2419782 RepID=A0A3B0C9U9_9FLAO|nr:hypothetical protein D7Z94_10685 [Ulvibacterium marinum]